MEIRGGKFKSVLSESALGNTNQDQVIVKYGSCQEWWDCDAQPKCMLIEHQYETCWPNVKLDRFEEELDSQKVNLYLLLFCCGVI